jgi:hypothetical protein
MTGERNECYPVLPSTGWSSKSRERRARRVAVDARNVLIGEVGAQCAVAAAGASIGGGKKEAKGK